MTGTGFRFNLRSLVMNRLLANICLLAIGFQLTAPLTSAQTFKVLHIFKGKGDGRLPNGPLARDATGNLYGTTNLGGRFPFGTVFKLSADGKKRILHSFEAVDGSFPEASVIRDSDGTLYGTTYEGGKAEGGKCEHGCGAVFALDKTGKEQVLYAFTGGTDGSNPTAGLVRDTEGNLYGTTAAGGDLDCGGGCGTVFKIDPAGKETVLHSFAAGADGDYPLAGLIRDASGNLYGTTESGGSQNCEYNLGCGTVFKLDSAGVETILYNFSAQNDGIHPQSGLVRDDAGTLYGTTTQGGAYGFGTVFKLDSSGKETVLHSFTHGVDGATPMAGLIRDAQGNLYGTTYYGGDISCFEDEGCGVVFELDTTGTLTVLHTFEGLDGSIPAASLTRDQAGNLYGVTTAGGDLVCSDNGEVPGCGVVFEITP